MHKLKKMLHGVSAVKQNTLTTYDSLGGDEDAPPPPPPPPERNDALPSSLTPAPPVQNFLLIWLDRNIDEIDDEDCRDSINKLQQVVKTVHTFTDVNRCVDFITKIDKEKVFIIFSGSLGETTVPFAHELPQISSMYVFCENYTKHSQWAQQWAKVRGVFTSTVPICEALKQAIQELERNSISISFLTVDVGASKQHLDQLNQSFAQTKILKETILTTDFGNEHITSFIGYCRDQFLGNFAEFKNVDKFEKEYRDHPPIWWYTYPSFVYNILNRALNNMEVNVLMKMGFFIRSLHENIVQLHSQQFVSNNVSKVLNVYRGQGMTTIDLDRLMKTKGGLLSFNNFLSASKNRQVSLDYARETVETSNLLGVLFVITILPSADTTPFADISSDNNNQAQAEILFSIHSAFRINLVKQIDNANDRLWEINLTLVGANDDQLRKFNEEVQKHTFRHMKGWYRLGYLLTKHGEFTKAQQLCKAMLDQSSDSRDKANIYQMVGKIKNDQEEYAEAIKFYEKSIEIKLSLPTPDQSDVALAYDQIGSVYDKLGDYPKALGSHQKGLEIREKTLTPYHADLAVSYSYLGHVCDKMREYTKAHSHFKRALDIAQRTLPANHPDIKTYKKSVEVENKKLETITTLYSNKFVD